MPTYHCIMLCKHLAEGIKKGFPHHHLIKYSVMSLQGAFNFTKMGYKGSQVLKMKQILPLHALGS